MRDAGTIPGTPLHPTLAPRRKLAPLPRSPSLRRVGVQADGCQRAMWGATWSNQRLGAGGAPVPIAHPLAVPRLGAELSPCPGLHRASPAKPAEPPALRWLCPGLHLPPQLICEHAGCCTQPPVLKQREPDPKNGTIDPKAARASSVAGRAAGSASHQDAPASDPTAGAGTPGNRLPTAWCSSYGAPWGETPPSPAPRASPGFSPLEKLGRFISQQWSGAGAGAAGAGGCRCVPQDSPASAVPVHTSHESLGIINAAIGAEHISAAGEAGKVCTQ